MARTNVKLATFEPTMLPTANAVPSAPSVSAARVETTSSGALVPNPMMRAPVTTVETRNRAATCAAPTTKRSAK